MKKMNFLKFNGSIGQKMIIFCLLMLIVPVALVGTFGYRVAKTETDALIEKDLQHSVRLAVQMAGLLHQSAAEGQLTLEEAQEKMKQMILGPRNEDGTRPINKNIDLGENGYFFVLDLQGNLLAHPLLEGENLWDKQSSDGVYYIQDMIKKAQNGGGFTYYEWPLPDSSTEALKVSYAEIMPEWNWIFAAGSYFQDYNSGQKRIFNSVWITLAVCIVAGSVFVYAFARYLSRPIEEMADYSAEIAQGNLAVQPLARTRKDEIGRLSSHFNEMAKTLRALVSEAVYAAENVRLSAEQLSAAMSNATASTRQITESIEELSAGMENQAKGTEESSRVMEEMAQGIQHIAETSSIAFDAAENMSRHAQEGNEKIQQSIRQMDSIRSAFDGLVVTIRQLVEYSSRIEEINITINDIASQTHLLALNASIEAARAGEQGKGFAVVAEEVRKLADQSANSSRQITQLVEAVQKTIHSAQQVVKQSGEEVDNGVSVIQETGRAFLSILTYARLVLEKIEDASSVAEQMSAGSQEIAASIQEISRITAESSGRAQEISAAAEEQLAIIRDIESRTRELNEQARRLQNQVQKFRV